MNIRYPIYEGVYRILTLRCYTFLRREVFRFRCPSRPAGACFGDKSLVFSPGFRFPPKRSSKALAEYAFPSRDPFTTVRVSWSMNVTPTMRPFSLRRM